jgi:putative tricarboxylic transport membrane protein
MRNTHGFIYPLFLTSKELIYQLFACGLLGIIAYGVIEYFGASQVARLIFRVPTKVLYPTIFLTSFTAAYSG